MHIRNVRFLIAAVTTFSAYAVYVSRVNLSIAIIAMVEDHHLEDQRNAELSSGKILKSDIPVLTVQNSSTNEQTYLSTHSSSATGLQGRDNVTTATNLLQNSQNQDHFAPIFVKAKKASEMSLISKDKFQWNQAEQGHILGAFFYGYILFQIPGARMAESVGAKWIIMAASAGSAVISLAFPLSTQLNSIYLLMMLRFVMGLCQSAFFPAAYVLFCRWLPENERAVLLPLMFLGSNVGSISTYITSSYLISSSYGWPLVFYLSGMTCLLCSLVWFVIGSNEPRDNWLITPEERRLIEKSIEIENSESGSFTGHQQVAVNENGADAGAGDYDEAGNGDADDLELAAQRKKLTSNGSLNKTTSGRVQPEPSWSKLLKSVPVWTLILSMYGNEWSNVVVCYELPTYLNTALGFPIEQNGVINSFFQLSYAVTSPIMSSLGAYMLEHHLFGMRKIHVRKLFQSLATFGQMICFLSVPVCGANRGLIIVLMFSAIIFRACCNAGDLIVAGDLSPEYAGTIFAFANSFGNTAGFFAPGLAGVFIENPYDRDQWAPFWLTTATIMGCSGFIFLVFGETRRQDFSLDEPHKQLQVNQQNSELITISGGEQQCIRSEKIDNNKTKTRTTIV